MKVQAKVPAWPSRRALLMAGSVAAIAGMPRVEPQPRVVIRGGWVVLDTDR
jgi:hypothetical protein